jgi:hypothetical protein
MYTAFKITDLSFFQTLFPNFEITDAFKEKINKIIFSGSESSNGFRINKGAFFKKLKEFDLLTPEHPLPPSHSFLITDKEAEAESALFG